MCEGAFSYPPLLPPPPLRAQPGEGERAKLLNATSVGLGELSELTVWGQKGSGELWLCRDRGIRLVSVCVCERERVGVCVCVLVGVK